MWPAVPRIIVSPSPALLFPELHCLERPAIREMLGKEFSQQPLVCTHGVFVEHDLFSSEHLLQRRAGFGRKHPAGGCQPAAARAERPTRRMTEERGGIGV